MTITPTARPSRRRATIVEGIAALAALLALLLLPPLGLALAVGNPEPAHLVVDGRLTDDAVIGLLAGIVWLAWAQLVVVIVIEATAAIRGRGLPRMLPGCGLQQYLARRLVVTASVLLAGLGTTATIAAATPATAAVAVCAPLQADVATVAVPPAHIPAPAPIASPTSVASTAAIPTDRRGAVEEAGPWYVVKPPRGSHHDSLWGIAERHLGDGLRWREIFDLNHHRPQPDGHRLELGRLIQPGWRLLMPTDAAGITEPHRDAAPKAPRVDAERNAPRPHTAPIPQARRAHVAIPPAVKTPAPPAAPTPIGAVTSTEDRATSDDAAVNPRPAASRDEEPAVPFGSLTLGLGAVAAAGVIAELARRRRRAQRFRRPGERLSKPTAEAAATERLLRTANAELTVIALRDALRDLADTCRATGRALPDVHAIRLNAESVTLLLGTDDPDAVRPFTAADASTWTATAGAFAGRNDDSAAEYTDPYPALVALGVHDDAMLLINLEAAGTLTLVGDPEETRPILRALILELGTSELTATAQLVLTDCPPDLAEMLDRGRVTVLAAADVYQCAERRRSDIGDLLTCAGVPNLAAARLAQVADDAWAPAVLIPGGHPAVSASGAGASMIRLAEPGTDADGWVLAKAAEGWQLDPHGIPVNPQRLSAEMAAPLAAALATAAGPAVAPNADPSIELGGISVAGEGVTPPETVEPKDVVRGSPVVDPSAGEETTEDAAVAPRVLVLGHVEILGVSDDGAPGRRRRATELVAYLALHPGVTQHQLDEALWPGCRVSRNTRNPLVSRTRQWLGVGVDGHPYLGLVADGGTYSLSSAVSSDWQEFQTLSRRGVAAGPAGVDDLVAALGLVRGRPFVGVNPAAYGWAEMDTQDMISAIVDAAEALAKIALDSGDYCRVRWAASRGLAAEPLAERLYVLAADAAAASGDLAEAECLMSKLRRQIQALDPDDDLALPDAYVR